MNNKYLVFLVLFLSAITTQAQTSKSPVVMKINDVPVTKSEFEYAYKKNNTENSIEKKSLEEYVDMYTNYRLRVEEAKALGLDTAQQFVKEFNGHKDQLIQPMLEDTVTAQDYARKLYGRTNENFELSHILLRSTKQQMFPSDTLELYQKAIEIRNRLIGKKAEPFEKVAKEVSQDPYAQMAEKPGHLGWGTTMMFIKPFEDAFYAMKTNEISMPVRTSFGYHIIKVENKRKDPGMVNTAHIMLGFSRQNPSKEETDSLQNLANSLYSRIIAGEDYAKLAAEYSSDKQSAPNGGDLGWFSIETRLPNEFKDAAFLLQNIGDISKPIKTPFGFHILKLINKKDRPSWDETKSAFIQQVKRSDRADDLTGLSVVKLEKDFDFQLNQDVFNRIRNLTNNMFPNDSAFIQDIENDNRVLFTIDAIPYKVSDLGKYIAANPYSVTNVNLSTDAFNKFYMNYLHSVLKDKKKSKIIANNDEIRNLVQEYHDGILYFNVMNQEVWEKAAADTLGLTNFFAENSVKYKWDEPRYKGIVVHAKDAETLKKVESVVKKNKKAKDLVAVLKEAFANDSITPIRIEKGVWKNNENKYVGYQIVNNKKGEKPLYSEKYPEFTVIGKFISAPQEYTDVKGLVISDYQDFLEKSWLEALRKKYSVQVFDDVLSTIK